MRGAIAYVRVSTEHQAANGISLDGQTIQIRRFAKEIGFKIMKVMRESASAMGDSIENRPVLREAADLSDRKGWPIIVASFDRFTRNLAKAENLVLKNKLHIISASNGPDADYLVLRSQAARAQKEGREIGRRTREGLAKAKARGTRLGNTVNLDEAQRKGADANRVLARQRAEEFARMLAEARQLGAQTADQIASTLNRAGYSTARGGPWTSANVYRVLRQLKPSGRGERQPASMPISRADTPEVDVTAEELEWLSVELKEQESRE